MKAISTESWWPTEKDQLAEIGVVERDGQRLVPDSCAWPTANMGSRGRRLFTPDEKAAWDAEVASAATERDATQWKHDRQAAYDAELGDWREQMAAIYDAVDSGILLKASKWFRKQKAIKARVPRPE